MQVDLLTPDDALEFGDPGLRASQLIDRFRLEADFRLLPGFGPRFRFNPAAPCAR